MNDFNCGSGPSTVSERLSIFNEIVRLSKKKEESTIVGNFTYQNVRVVELVAVLNYIIALYNFGLPVDNLYSIIEVYEQAKTKPGSCYFYILDFIEANFKSIHPVLLMLDHYTKDIYDLLKDEGQMIGKFQFYIMAKAIASYQVHTQDVINNLAARLRKFNKDITNKARFSASSETTLVASSQIENTGYLDEELAEKIEIESRSSKSNSTMNSIRSVNNNNNNNNNNSRNSLIKEESTDDDTLNDNISSSSSTNEKINSSPSEKFDIRNSVNSCNEDDITYNLSIEKKSMIYECITSLNVYSKFNNLISITTSNIVRSNDKYLHLVRNISILFHFVQSKSEISYRDGNQD